MQLTGPHSRSGPGPVTLPFYPASRLLLLWGPHSGHHRSAPTSSRAGPLLASPASPGGPGSMAHQSISRNLVLRYRLLFQAG